MNNTPLNHRDLSPPSAPRLIETDELPVYPVDRDERLEGHYFIKFWHDRWLNSHLHLTATLEVQACALNLFFLSQKQTPVGTLPDDDAILAKLLRIDLALWRDLRTRRINPLHGWSPCRCGEEIRLSHPVVTEVVLDAMAKRNGAEDPRHLWPHFARVIGECQPEWVFLENVANHLNLGYREVRGELEGLGYGVTEGLFTAAEVGAPHKRQRLFILARRNQLANSESQRQRKPSDQADALATGRNTRNEPCDQGGDVADTPDRQFSHTGWCAQERERSGSHGAGLADTDGERRLQTQRGQPEVGRPDPCGGDVADATGAGLEGHQQSRACETETTGPQSHGSTGKLCRVFPPGPHDLGGWRDYLRSAPQLEPSFRRGADGLANRVDRLRLCGNGVVPLVAAHAFRILAARFDGG